MRRLTPVPAKSLEILVLESPEAFACALLARPPLAEQNHIIARDRDESLRRFALRVLGRVRRMLRDPNQVVRISYLFGGEGTGDRVRSRLLSALATALARQGSLRVVGPRDSTDVMFGYLDALSPRLPLGSRIEARVSPTGWMIMSAGADRAHSPAPF